MQGLSSLNAGADSARSLLKDKSGEGFLGAAKDAGESVLREGTSVVLGLSTLGAYTVGGQRPPGFDRWPDVKKLVIGMVDGKEIEDAWKSDHPWKAGGMGAGVAREHVPWPGRKGREGRAGGGRSRCRPARGNPSRGPNRRRREGNWWRSERGID